MTDSENSSFPVSSAVIFLTLMLSKISGELGISHKKISGGKINIILHICLIFRDFHYFCNGQTQDSHGAKNFYNAMASQFTRRSLIIVQDL